MSLRHASRRADLGSEARSSRLLVDAPEFLAAVEPALLRAHDRVLIQVMTFELDSVGRRFWDLLVRSNAREKILCVDAFSTAKVSDDLVFGARYFTDAAFRREARDTRRLLRQQQQDGVRIVLTNPLGRLWWKYPFRNHKKMMIVDDRAFLGGINLSEHNFTWRDLMLETDCPPLVDALTEDFRRTIAGINSSCVQQTPIGELCLLDGRNSRAEYERIFNRIADANSSVDLISPYVSNPLLQRLARLPASVRVRVINPARNNKRIMQQALFRAAAGTNLEILLYQREMSHVKAILIDDTELILGSNNFDFVGYDLQQELTLCANEPALVQEFRDRVLSPTLEVSAPAHAAPARFYHRGGVVLALAQWYVSLLSRLRR